MDRNGRSAFPLRVRGLAAAAAGLLVAAGFGGGAKAAEPEPYADLESLTLEDLLKVSVATKTEMSERESPAIVTAVTREEIRNSGARDIDDVLRMVPGFDFAADYYGTVGISVRGLWGIEGKVLLLIDGIPATELYYNGVVIGNRVPIDQINRVEIIRGPGSVIYGGAAEYAVVNLITESGAQTSGIRATTVYGQLAHSYGRASASVVYGQRFGVREDDPEVSVKVYGAQSQRSDREVLYPDGTRLSAVDAYRSTPVSANLAASWKGLSARLIVDRGGQQFQDYAGEPLSKPAVVRFDNTFAEVKYAWKPVEGLTVTPQYTFGRSYSYGNTDYGAVTVSGVPAGAGGIVFDPQVNRHRMTVSALDEVLPTLSLLAGGEAIIDHATSNRNAFVPDASNPTITSQYLDFHSYAGYGQLLWQTPAGTFTAGGRAEWHSQYGGSLVPRFAWTKAFERFHFKALYSRAFKNPSVGNINDSATVGTTVKPERTRDMELEAGYRFTPHQQVVVNAFDTRIFGPIVYVPATSGYANYRQTGSRGIEAEYRFNDSWGYARLNYSFYTTEGINQVERYTVAQDPAQLAGFSPHKASLGASVRLPHGMRFNPSAVFIGQRYQFTALTPGAAALATTEVKPTLFLNLYFTADDLIAPGVDLGAGIYNLLGQGFQYPTAYDFNRNPLPAQSREFLVRLSYRFAL
jgi:outer membrane cobalamin receptor